MDNLLVIAHRGASGHAPEHTFAAWDQALAAGADYLEQDLQLTRDGVLVVMHDETLDRTARADGRRCEGRVLDRTLAELRACEVGSWFNEARPDLARPEYAGEPVPTLEAVFQRYRARAAFYIETKRPEIAPGMEEALLSLLEQYDLLAPAASEWRVVIQSFSEASLRRIHGRAPALPLIQLLEREQRPGPADLARIAEYAVGIGPHFSGADPALIAGAHGLCLAVHPYTVNEPADQARLAAAGVNGMFTDYPAQLLATRPADEPRGPRGAAAAAAARRRCVELSARGGRAAGS